MMEKDGIRTKITYLRTVTAPGSSIIGKEKSIGQLSQRLMKQRRMRPWATCGPRPSATKIKLGR